MKIQFLINVSNANGHDKNMLSDRVCLSKNVSDGNYGENVWWGEGASDVISAFNASVASW